MLPVAYVEYGVGFRLKSIDNVNSCATVEHQNTGELQNTSIPICSVSQRYNIKAKFAKRKVTNPFSIFDKSFLNIFVASHWNNCVEDVIALKQVL